MNLNLNDNGLVGVNNANVRFANDVGRLLDSTRGDDDFLNPVSTSDLGIGELRSNGFGVGTRSPLSDTVVGNPDSAVLFTGAMSKGANNVGTQYNNGMVNMAAQDNMAAQYGGDTYAANAAMNGMNGANNTNGVRVTTAAQVTTAAGGTASAVRVVNVPASSAAPSVPASSTLPAPAANICTLPGLSSCPNAKVLCSSYGASTCPTMCTQSALDACNNADTLCSSHCSGSAMYWWIIIILAIVLIIAIVVAIWGWMRKPKPATAGVETKSAYYTTTGARPSGTITTPPPQVRSPMPSIPPSGVRQY